MKIGDKVWRFNENRRVYRRNHPGDIYSSGPPIYREHWEERTIVAENRRSWITDLGYKIPKKGDCDGWCISEQELDDACYVNDNRHLIASAVHREERADILRQIAALLDMKASGDAAE